MRSIINANVSDGREESSSWPFEKIEDLYLKKNEKSRSICMPRGENKKRIRVVWKGQLIIAKDDGNCRVNDTELSSLLMTLSDGDELPAFHQNFQQLDYLR